MTQAPETCNSPDTSSNISRSKRDHSMNFASACKLWKEHGGSQHGPHTETIEMPLERFAGFIAAFIEAQPAPALPQDVAALVDELEYCPAIAYEPVKQAVAVLRAQSSTIASAREVIEQIAEGSIDVSETAIILGRPKARDALRAARDWKGR